jgi:excisionase family DNA binding protein
METIFKFGQPDSDPQNWPDELKKILNALIDLASVAIASHNNTLSLNAVLTAEELANRLKIPVSTIEELARKGKLSGAFRIGKHWRFDIDALRGHLDGVVGEES